MAPVPAVDGAMSQESGWDVARAGKGITLVAFNDDMDEIIRIIKLPENSAVLMNRVSETVKQNIKIIRLISWHVIRNFSCFSIRKYLNLRKSHESWNIL